MVIPSERKSCCLCQEISTRRFPQEYYSQYPVETRFCYENSHFLAFPSISPLTTGHVLIVPKTHSTSILSLPLDVRADLLATAETVGVRLGALFGDLFVFEHGVGSEGTNCGVDHAHMHMLPLGKDLAARASRIVTSTLGDPTRAIFSQLGRLQHHGSYILLGNHLDHIDLILDASFPSQFMRQIIADLVGSPRWDWREFFGREEFLRTCQAFGLPAAHGPVHYVTSGA